MCVFMCIESSGQRRVSFLSFCVYAWMTMYVYMCVQMYVHMCVFMCVWSEVNLRYLSSEPPTLFSDTASLGVEPH